MLIHRRVIPAHVAAVRTNYDVVRWTAIQTLFALGLVLPATALGLLWLCGGDVSRSVSALATLRFGLALAAVEALVFAPVVALRSSKTLRKLTLARDELDRLAHFDSLTGLLNRRAFDKVAAGALATPATLGRPAAALMCDLDHFKRINDRLGHEFGDAALRHVANVLREAAGQDNIVLARVGGEEFARRCHVVGGLVAKEHDENQLLQISVPSGDHSPGDLALSPVHTQLS